MTDAEFVGIIPGVIDDQARDAGLSGGAVGLYRLLIEHADRHTGDLHPITVAELASLSRFGRKAVRRYLDELEIAGLLEVELHQGHDGRIRVVRHSEVVFKGRSRRSTQRSRQSALGSRRSTHGSRTSTRANRENGHREKKTERSSTSLSSVGARADGSAGATPPGGTAGRDKTARAVSLERSTAWRLYRAQTADGWGDADAGIYVDPFAEQLDAIGYWDDEATDVREFTHAQLAQIWDVCDVADRWLNGERVAWMPDRRHGPYYDGPIAALARLGLSADDAENWGLRFHDLDATEAFEEFVAAAEPLDLDLDEVLADLETLHDEAQARQETSP